MASELRVNTLKDAAGNNSVGMEYVANGSAKLWSNVQSDQSTSNDSFNVSSTVDSGVGLCRRNAVNSFSQDPQSHASVHLTQYNSAGQNRLNGAKGTSAIETLVRNTSNSAHDQPNSCSSFGDLA